MPHHIFPSRASLSVSNLDTMLAEAHSAALDGALNLTGFSGLHEVFELTLFTGSPALARDLARVSNETLARHAHLHVEDELTEEIMA